MPLLIQVGVLDHSVVSTQTKLTDEQIKNLTDADPVDWQGRENLYSLLTTNSDFAINYDDDIDSDTADTFIEEIDNYLTGQNLFIYEWGNKTAEVLINSADTTTMYRSRRIYSMLGKYDSQNYPQELVYRMTWKTLDVGDELYKKIILAMIMTDGKNKDTRSKSFWDIITSFSIVKFDKKVIYRENVYQQGHNLFDEACLIYHQSLQNNRELHDKQQELKRLQNRLEENERFMKKEFEKKKKIIEYEIELKKKEIEKYTLI